MPALPRLYTDSLRLSMDTLERLKPRGGGRWEGMQRDPVEAVEWVGRATPPDLVAKLREELKRR